MELVNYFRMIYILPTIYINFIYYFQLMIFNFYFINYVVFKNPIT